MNDDAIRLDDVTVSYGQGDQLVTALKSVSLKVPGGSVLGLLGPNGAGKTTLIHILLGFIAPTAGMARIMHADARDPQIRKQIGYLPEHPETYRFLTGRELLNIACSWFNLPRKHRRKYVLDALHTVNLSAAADRRISTYSCGMLQRLGIAQALINDPAILILDEPTNGLDPPGRLAVRNLIRQLRSDGKTILLSSHELSEIELVCDHLVIMHEGEIKAQGSTKELVPQDERLERYFMRVIGTETDSME